MQNTVMLRGLAVGEGMPKIIVSVSEKTEDAILRKTQEILETRPDAVEWRADHFAGLFDKDAVVSVLGGLRRILSDTPLLFTVRTEREGGAADPGPKRYAEILRTAADSGFADAVDVEVFMDERMAEETIEAVHAAGIPVVASNHDFHRTPEKEEIIRRLCRMQELGADILKIALMPVSGEDVLTLLTATHEMKTRFASRPLITMSMGAEGVVSRVSGEVFGSAMTFGAVGQASAPGQLPVGELRKALDILHRGMAG